MATFGNTIIACEDMGKWDQPAHLLDALRDLHRLAELVVLGREHDLEGFEDDGALLHSLIWPMNKITERLMELHKPAEAAAAPVVPLRRAKPSANRKRA